MKLYSYYASSASYRVRIALGLKGLDAEYAFVNLGKGEHKSAAYAAVNPQQLIPSLVDNDGNVLTQSLAIIEYLEEKFPTPSLLPTTPVARARVRSLAYVIASDLAPLNNLKLRQYIKSEYRADEQRWIQHWTHNGLLAFEKMLNATQGTGSFCHGSTPGMADCVLIPQLFNARRFGCDLSAYPTILHIDAACAKLPAFIAAHPSSQPDAV